MSTFINDKSQYGEVELLIRLFVNDAARHKIVVDVGANGVERSNSYDFLKHFGWRGLLIEPNPALARSIREGFAGLDFALVECAVSDFEGAASLHLGVNVDISSLDQAATAAWGAVSGAVEVSVRRLGPILAEQAIPPDFDLLSLDIENHDIRVLNDLVASTPYRPGYILFEGSHRGAVESFAKLEAMGMHPSVKSFYAFAGQTEANIVFRRLAAARGG